MKPLPVAPVVPGPIVPQSDEENKRERSLSSPPILRASSDSNSWLNGNQSETAHSATAPGAHSAQPIPEFQKLVIASDRNQAINNAPHAQQQHQPQQYANSPTQSAMQAMGTLMSGVGNSINHNEKSGWLTKKGSKVKNYKYRFFVLDKSAKRMNYFGDRISHVPKGTLHLKGATLRATHDSKCPGFGFDVVTSHRTYVLSAKTQAEMSEWMTAIQNAISG